MKAIVGSIVLVIALMTLTAIAQEPTAFRGVPWGATQKEAKKLLRFEYCEKTGCLSHFKLGSADIESIMTFDAGDRFVSTTGSFASGDYLTVKQAFTDKYGPPTRVESSMVSNALGAKFEQESLIWEGLTSHIVLSKYVKVTEGIFVISTKDYWDALNKEQQDKQAAAKDAL